jgi:tetratricopeptide (TPR) repeat protein
LTIQICAVKYLPMLLNSSPIHRMFFISMTIGTIALAIHGCGHYKALNQINSPNYHVTNGDKFLGRGMLPEAEKEFAAAQELDHYNVAACVGLALVKSRQADFVQARQFLYRASTLASDPASQYLILVGNLQVNTGEKGKDWLEQALSCHEKAVSLNPNAADAYYFMGLAYKESFNFQDAKNMFQKAQEIDGPLQKDAAVEASLMESIRSNPPQTLAGKKAVLINRMRRGHMAALFTQELELEHWIVMPDVKSRTEIAIQDLQNHTYQRDISTIIRLGIQGLQLYPTGNFRPDEPITRADMAIMAQSIIIKATGKEELANLYQGRKTPFSDLSNESPYFNAAMLNVTWEIMPLSSDAEEFDPLGPVSGVDALRTVYRLRQKIIEIKRDSLFKMWKDLPNPLLEHVSA